MVRTLCFHRAKEPFVSVQQLARISAEQGGQLDPQSVAVQSVGVLIGSPSLIAGKLPLSFAYMCDCKAPSVSYWLLADNAVEDLNVNSWQWGATTALIQRSNILEPEVEIFGDRMVFAGADSCIKLANWLETHVLVNLADGSRIKLDGSATNEPDGGTFHRDDLAENYSVDREWLLIFVLFLRECGGFRTLG